MLDTNPLAVLDLRSRTRQRNRGVWTPMLAGTALALDEANLNALYLDTIEAPVAIADEVYAVKEYERDQGHSIALQEVNLELQGVLDGFGFVQSRLADLYVLWQIKDRVMAVKIKSAYDLIDETNQLFTAELAAETLHLTAMQNDQEVLAYETVKSQAELQAEAALKSQVVAAKEALQNANAGSREQLSTLRLQMELLVNVAKRWLYVNRTRIYQSMSFTQENIGKGGAGGTLFIPGPKVPPPTI